MGVGLALAAALVALVVSFPLDSQPVAQRLYYHFHANNHFDPARKPLVVPDLPFQLTDDDYADILQMVDPDGRVHSISAGSAVSADHVATDFTWQWVPSSWRGGTVNGTTAYASFIQRDNPQGALAMLRVRDRVVARINEHKVLDHDVYGVEESVPWAAFSITSEPSRLGEFRWHYDAESSAEYRALFVARGGDDCDAPAVHYRNSNGDIQNLSVKTGHGYLIRGSQTFHAVYGGGCATDGESAIRHMIGFQLSQLPNRHPMPVCAIMLNCSAYINALMAVFPWLSASTTALLLICSTLLLLLRRRAADVYDLFITHMTTRWYSAVLADIKSRDSASDGSEPYRVLDVGIGTATALVANANALRVAGVEVVGVDYLQDYIDKAQLVVRAAGVDDIVELHCASFFDDDLASRVLGTESRRFDAVYFSGSFTLLPDMPEALQICRRLVKPGGQIFITQTFQTEYSPLMAAVKPLLKYLTTVDFGQLTYEEELNGLLEDSESRGLELLSNEVMESPHLGGGVCRMIVLEVTQVIEEAASPAISPASSPTPATRAELHQPLPTPHCRAETPLTICTYNVFTGTLSHEPGGPLASSGRMHGQIERLRALKPSVLCLQEVFLTSHARAYANSLAEDGYSAFYVELPLHKRWLPFIAWHAFLAMLPSLVIALFVPTKLALLFGGNLVLAGFVYLMLAMRSKGAVLRNFLTGEIDGGLVTLWRHDMVSLVSSDDASCVKFKSLGGEWEDKLLFKWLRPRTFHRLRLRLTDAALPDGIGCDSPSEASRSILVFNLHAMLGCDGEATSRRQEQLREILRAMPQSAAERDAGCSVFVAGDLNINASEYEKGTVEDVLAVEGGLVDLCEEFGEPGEASDTWSAKNFLTFGWHSEEDGRVDYVYYRPPIVSGGHEEEQLEILTGFEKIRTLLGTEPYLSDHFGVLASANILGHNRQLVRTAEQRLKANAPRGKHLLGLPREYVYQTSAE